MRAILIIIAAILITACASDYNYPSQPAVDLCLSKGIEVYPNYIMKSGRHHLVRTSRQFNYYATNNLTGTVSSVSFVKTRKLSDTEVEICMDEFNHEYCGHTDQVAYCPQ